VVEIYGFERPEEGECRTGVLLALCVGEAPPVAPAAAVVVAEEMSPRSVRKFKSIRTAVAASWHPPVMSHEAHVTVCPTLARSGLLLEVPHGADMSDEGSPTRTGQELNVRKSVPHQKLEIESSVSSKNIKWHVPAPTGGSVGTDAKRLGTSSSRRAHHPGTLATWASG
jgi:hypothetical protein